MTFAFIPADSGNVSLVKGYVKSSLPPIKDSYVDWYRFEIIQHTFFSENLRQTSFDYELNTLLIKSIVAFFLPHSLLIHMESGREITSLDEYAEYVSSQKKIAEAEDETDIAADDFEEMRLFNQEKNTEVYVRIHYWNRIGGDYPYSDSYAYEIYSGKNLTADLQNYYLRIFNENNIFIHEILSGNLVYQKEKRSLLDILTKWLFATPPDYRQRPVTTAYTMA